MNTDTLSTANEMILAAVALALAVIALGLAVYLLLTRKKKKKQDGPKKSEVALQLAEKLDKEFEERCREIAGKIVKEELEALQQAVPVQEVEEPEPVAVEEPVAAVFVSKKYFGEYSDSDNGFFVEDLKESRVERSQVEIDTLSEEMAEFSIIPDVDKTLVPGLKECCTVQQGDWMNFNTIRTVAKGTMRLNGEIWSLVDKVTVVLE